MKKGKNDRRIHKNIGKRKRAWHKIRKLKMRSVLHDTRKENKEQSSESA